MKKTVFLLLILLLPVFAGCQESNSSIVSFYYPVDNYGYDSTTGLFSQSVMDMEARECSDGLHARNLLNLYLDGPQTQTLRNPFPEGMEILSLYTEQDTLKMTVSDTLGDLTGIPLYVACACLSRTAMELTGTSEVEIQCSSALLNGKQALRFTAKTVIHTDTVTHPPEDKE